MGLTQSCLGWQKWDWLAPFLQGGETVGALPGAHFFANEQAGECTAVRLSRSASKFDQSKLS